MILWSDSRGSAMEDILLENGIYIWVAACRYAQQELFR